MSTLNVFAKIRQSFKGKNGEKFKLNSGKVTRPPSTYSEADAPETFKSIFEGNQKSGELYQECFGSLIKPFLNGCNISTLIFGETDSGQYSTLFGGEVGDIVKPSKKHTGVLVMLVNDLLSVKRAQEYPDNQRPLIRISLMEIRDKALFDLLIPNDDERDPPANPFLADNELEGIIIKNVTQLEVIGAKDCLTLIENAFRSNGIGGNTSEYEDSSLVIQFEMIKPMLGTPLPLKSLYRIFILPGAEKLLSNPADPNTMPEQNSTNIVTFGKIVMQLSEKITADSPLPSYRATTLTTLLTDALGGNCITNALVTFKPFKSEAAALVTSYGLRMKKIINYPIQNTPNSKGLIRRYRWLLKRSQTAFSEERKLDKALIEELNATIQNLQKELEAATAKNEELAQQQQQADGKLVDANKKYAELTSSRTNLSSRMVMSEQEKLMLSKSIVDLKLENNAIKQEGERQIFQLKRKSTSLEEKMIDLERRLALEKRSHQDVREQASRTKHEFKDLTEEYINLKANYMSLSEAHQNLTSTNQRLFEEVGNLVDSKAQILKEKDSMEMQQIQEFTSRLKAIAKKVSRQSKSEKAEQRNSKFTEKLELEKQLLFNVQEREEKLESLREEHGCELLKLEEKLENMKDELKESQDQAERYKRKMAEQNSEMFILNNQKAQVDDLCKNLEDKLKELTQDYCQRLETYVMDLKDFIWSEDGKLQEKSTTEKIERVEQMIEGIKKAYDTDVEILNHKLNRTSNVSREILQKHEQLLTAYKLVLWKTGVGSNEEREIENDFEMPLPSIEELQMEELREKSETRTRLYLAEQRNKELEGKVEKLKMASKQHISASIQSKDEEEGNFSLRGLRKEMREFTVNVQLELENERAELITRLTIAEEQLAEYEQYIDSYTKRYQHEIMHLRKLLSESGRLHSADAVMGPDGPPARALPPIQGPRRYSERQGVLRY